MSLRSYQDQVAYEEWRFAESERLRGPECGACLDTGIVHGRRSVSTCSCGANPNARRKVDLRW